MTVVVIGAGLSGLAAARTLQRSGQKVMVLEQASEIGGRVQTLDIDGYRVDKGFQVLLTAYQEAAEVWPEHEMDKNQPTPAIQLSPAPGPRPSAPSPDWTAHQSRCTFCWAIITSQVIARPIITS